MGRRDIPECTGSRCGGERPSQRRPVATSTRRAHLRERIERLCRSADDDRSLRLSVLAEVRRAVPFDAHVWVVTDPRTWVGCAPLADVPCPLELPRLIRLTYVTDVNRRTGLLSRFGIVDVASMSCVEPLRVMGLSRAVEVGVRATLRRGGTRGAGRAERAADDRAPGLPGPDLRDPPT